MLLAAPWQQQSYDPSKWGVLTPHWDHSRGVFSKGPEEAPKSDQEIVNSTRIKQKIKSDVTSNENQSVKSLWFTTLCRMILWRKQRTFCANITLRSFFNMFIRKSLKSNFEACYLMFGLDFSHRVTKVFIIGQCYLDI